MYETAFHVFQQYGGTPFNIYGADGTNLLRILCEIPPTNFSNTTIYGNTRLTHLHRALLNATGMHPHFAEAAKPRPLAHSIM